MRNLSKILQIPVFVIILLLVLSCKREDVIESAADAASPAKREVELENLLIRFGFDKHQIVDGGDHYVVEKDIVILKETLREKIQHCGDSVAVSANGRKDQWAVNQSGVVNWSKAGSMTFSIHPGVNNLPNAADWIAAIRQAALDWSQITEANIEISERAYAIISPTSIVFYSDAAAAPACLQNLPWTTFARAIFPYNGDPGYAISINDNGPFTNAVFKITTIRHEIGHTLGFRHSNWNSVDTNGDGVPDSSELTDDPNACGNPVYGANLIFGTPQRDVNSIMFGAGDGVTNIPFNDNDLRAARLLYPDNLITPVITGFSVCCNSGRDFTYRVTVTNVDPKAAGLVVYGVSSTTGQRVVLGRLTPVAGTRTFTTSAPFSRSTVQVRATNYKSDFGSNYSNYP